MVLILCAELMMSDVREGIASTDFRFQKIRKLKFKSFKNKRSKLYEFSEQKNMLTI